MTTHNLLKCAALLLVTLPSRATPAQQLPASARSASKETMPFTIANEAAFFQSLDLNRPELAKVKSAVQAQDWTAAKAAWARHLETRTSPHWFWSRRDKTQITDFLKQNDGGLARYIKPADAVLRREFNPQGVPYQLEHNMSWILPNSEETHVLSRFSYFRDQGLAYWQTGDAKYPADFVAILRDWLADNPVPNTLEGAQKHNTTWRTLEAGIRSESWWDTMQLFMDAPQFDAEAKYQMSKSLMEHARYLAGWNTIYRRGNWQVVETSGLAMTGIMMPEAKDAGAWRERAFALLSEHMQKDVLPDGSHSELTPGYHSVVMGLFTRVSLLAKANGYAVSGLTGRHEKMFEWLMKIGQPSRTAPRIGDERNHALATDLATGALLYNRPDMRFFGAPKAPASWVWLFGADAAQKYAQIPARQPEFTSIMTPDSKYLVMRGGWDKNDPYLLFNNAPYGGGHSHNDRLEVVLHAGRDLLLDPGIYSYNQPLSTSYFRKGIAHNVLLFDDKEQPKVDPQVLAWQTTPQADFASGMVESEGLKHQRSVLFVKPGYWVVVDHVSGAGEHEIKRLFHFPIGEVRSEGNSARTAFATGTNLQVQVADGARLEMGSGWVPTGGATAEASPTAVFVSKGALPMTLVTVLTPFSDGNALPKVENLGGGSPIAHLRLTFPDGQRDEIEVSPQVTDFGLGAQKTLGRAMLRRQGPHFNFSLILDGS